MDATRSQSLLYDELNRLTDATNNYGDIDYAYDAIGNRLSETVDATAEAYTYDATSHQLLQTVNGGVTDYTYDANGNTTSNTTNTFTFGDNNRLQTVQDGGSTLATYKYNGRGERVKKDGTSITYYHYDQGGQLIAETDATGTTQVEYIYVDGQPLALVTGGAMNYIHNDHLGTPQQISDVSQVVVWKADYNPFGEATMTTELITNNLRFPGQYYDEETGLHYNWYRYYDPSIGRYIMSDRVGLFGGMNTYAYVSSNPIVYFDPNGLDQMRRSGSAPGGRSGSANASALLGGSVHFGVLGFSITSGTITDVTSGKTCFLSVMCFRVGPGVAIGGGASVSVSVSNTKLCSGEFMTNGGFISGGAGVFGSASLNFSDGLNGLSGATGLAGAGGGGALGFQRCNIRLICDDECSDC